MEIKRLLMNKKYVKYFWFGVIWLSIQLYLANMTNLYRDEYTEGDEVSLLYEIHELGIPKECEILKFDMIDVLGGDRIIFCKFNSKEKTEFYLERAKNCQWNNLSYTGNSISGEKGENKLYVKIDNDRTTTIYVYITRSMWGDLVKTIYCI